MDYLLRPHSFSSLLEKFQREAGQPTSHDCCGERDHKAVETEEYPLRSLLHLSTCVITISVAKYKYAKLKKCCYDGANRNDDESCEQRAARITIGPKCITAFKECCAIANKFRSEESHKEVRLGRLRKFDIFYENSAQYGEFCVILCSI